MKRLETLAAIVILLAVATTARADWQYARDYLATQNDSSVAWQRGYLMGAEGETFTCYNTHEVAVADTLVGWHDASVGWDSYGNAVKNISGSDYDAAWGTYYKAGQATVMSGTGGPWAAVRWTAPTAGYYNVSANWTNQRTGGTDVTVTMRNNLTLNWLPNSTATLTEFAGTDSSVAAGKFSYNNTLYFAAGQNLDFVVESNSTLPQVAGLDARITAVPEPTAIVLFVSGMIGLLCYAWRKR
jgi:hypothetical protein